MANQPHIWKQDEVEILKTIYPNTSTSFVSRELNIPWYIVKGKIDKLKLHLLPKKERLCNTCWVNFQDKRAYGNRCKDCYNARRKVLRRTKLTTQSERFNELLRSTRYRARKAKLPFDLTLEFIQELFVKQEGKCYYSGIEMNFERWGSKRKKYSISIDRIIPSAGYIKSNIVLCSWAANVGKNNFTVDEYIRFCTAVAEQSRESRQVTL